MREDKIIAIVMLLVGLQVLGMWLAHLLCSVVNDRIKKSTKIHALWQMSTAPIFSWFTIALYILDLRYLKKETKK